MYLTTSVFFFLISVSDCQCPPRFEDANFIEKFIVKEDPFERINGKVFLDRYVRDFYTDITKCAYTEYLSQPDGSILEKAHYIHQTGVEVISGIEVVKRTDKIGIFSLSGTHVATQKEYSGKMYVFYASETVIGYYACEENGVNWNLAVQVTSDFKVRKTQMKGSLEEAYKRLGDMQNWPGTKIASAGFKPYYEYKNCL